MQLEEHLCLEPYVLSYNTQIPVHWKSNLLLPGSNVKIKVLAVATHRYFNLSQSSLEEPTASILHYDHGSRWGNHSQ